VADTLTAVTAMWPTPDALSGDGPRSRSEAELDALRRGEQVGKHHRQLNLSDSAMLWQTPATDSFRSRGGDRVDEMGLDQQTRTMWATPIANDAASGRTSLNSAGMKLGPQANNWDRCPSHPAPPTATPGPPSSPNGPTSRPRLSPRFVEWLQGFPQNWTLPCATVPTASAPSATPSFPSKQQPPSASSGGDWRETE